MGAHQPGQAGNVPRPTEGNPGPALILRLAHIDGSMLPLVGGKAANLGELTAAGLPVPDGFCLTTEAYKTVATTLQDGVLSELAELQSALEPGSQSGAAVLAEVAGKAREAIRALPVPPPVAAAVQQAYAALGKDTPVAVRSSATAEDLPFASFAGQQDTYLNVIGSTAVLEAVRACWASLWTDRAVAYRAALGIAPHEVALAVVVQRMVDAETAGVMFTANPLTGRRCEAVIDAAPGLGEAVVSGAVNPDHFVVDTEQARVLERKLGDKRIRIRPLSGGGTGTQDLSGRLDASSLTDGQAVELAVLGRQAERYFGAPQDTEWAIDAAGTPWLTQSRPITTLYPIPERRSAGTGTRVYVCFSLAQGLTRPLTPMGLASLRLIASSVATAAGIPVVDPRQGPPAYAEAAQRMYMDVTTPVRSAIGRRMLPRVFDVMEARSARVLRQVLDDPRFSVTRRNPAGIIRHVLPAAVRARVPGTLLRALFRPKAALHRLDSTTRQFAGDLELEAGAGPLARLDHAEQLLGSRMFAVAPAILPLPALGFALLWLAGKLLGGRDRGKDLEKVLRGLPRNITTEMDLDLWRLASAVKDDRDSRAALEERDPSVLSAEFRAGNLPPVLHSGLVRFLERYGQRAVAEIDVGIPRWSDDPTHILGVLANYLRLTDPAMAPDVLFSRAEAEAEAEVERLAGEARRRGRVRGLLVRAALRRTRLFAGLRELPKYQVVLGLAEVRKQLVQVGTGLAADGRLESPDDIFFLDFEEARRALRGLDTDGESEPRKLRGIILERRAAYARELGRRHIPRVLLSDGTEPEVLIAGDAAAASGALSGSPASAGSVTARARVILDPVGAHLEPGEILVAPSTDPGWTPLFLTAGGLVMEMGGPNSHGAVVAREYGIPAVVGVPEATARIVTGQKITVDGGAGTVVPEP
ncbi:phosphoenolpyruvate synthase [Arthrobacter sp. AFG7.2]|uniref:PEP/pyruvate-binding domain-containing protein n=1 Tax=Arthrobacter sp. AFG7.2 TaxID=1688693 RepID=UPI000C9DABA6|nr:PEP/pyruvate-binding domain-containing protein [Arthrobacter sp. AFG7.2]PNI08401.1 phosphoenolpyruvate synthase [Arthrobacter sp. AFG7.2]